MQFIAGSIIGIRGWMLTEYGLVSALMPTYRWSDGLNLAQCTSRCEMKSEHLNLVKPAEHTCGLYANHNLSEGGLMGSTVGIVSLTGRVQIGPYAMKASQGKILGMLKPSATKFVEKYYVDNQFLKMIQAKDSLFNKIMRIQYKDIEVFDSMEEMKQAFPLTDVSNLL